MPAATSTEARAPAASRGDFAAALQASEETRPSTASSAASPAALPIESSFGLAAAGNVSFGAPVAAAGTPAEVLPLHVEWLAARQGGNVRISLHPPELGELQLTVKVRGSAVDIVIQAREPAAQMAVLQSRELLVEALSSRDLHMEQFDVRGLHNDKGNEDSSSQTNTHPQQHGTARRGGEGREGGEGQPTPAELAMNSRNESGVELPVPPPVVEPQTAIDLRI